MSTQPGKPAEGAQRGAAERSTGRPFVADADGHVIEPVGLWEQYTERKYHSRLPRPILDENGLFCYVVDDTLLMRTASRLSTQPSTSGPRAETKAEEGDYPESGLRPGGWDAKARLADMDLDGMDLAFLYPTAAFFLFEVPDLELQRALCRAYNDWLADYCRAAPDRLVGIALLPLADVEWSIRELERCTERHGFRGVFARPNPYHGRLIQSRAYDPLWACAQSLGVPITVHEGISDSLPTLGRERSESPVLQHLFSHPFEQMTAAATLLLTGVTERYPRLNFVFLESGCGWLPYWLQRMDGHAKTWAHRLPGLKLKPSEYFQRQCFISMDPDDDCAPFVLAQVGSECMVWASDYPHTDHDFPGAVKSTLDILARAPAGAAEKVLGTNPARLYGLSPEQMRRAAVRG
jgi:predicted TIM-barrel fold metal-dependent hydrolase